MKKIFIIEDDINILYGLRDIFSSNDYEVEIDDANDELSSLVDRIKKFTPDIIVLDIVLPRIDGAEIIKTIKSDDVINDTDIVIFTDLSDEDGRSRSVGLGASYYFMKNEFDIYSFSNKVMRIISRSQNLIDGAENSDDSSDVIMD